MTEGRRAQSRKYSYASIAVICAAIQFSLLIVLIDRPLTSYSFVEWALLSFAIWNILQNSFVCASNVFRPAELFFRMFIIWHLCVPGLMQFNADQFNWKPHSYQAEDAYAAIAIIILTIISTEIAFRTRLFPGPRPAIRPTWDLHAGSVFVLCTLSALSAVVMISYFGVSIIYETRGELAARVAGAIEGEYARGIFLHMPRAASFCSFSILLFSLCSGRVGKRSLLAATAGCVFAAIVWLMLNNPIGLPRFVLMGQLIVLTYVIFSRASGGLNALYSIGYPVLLYTFIPFLGVYSRYSTLNFSGAYAALLAGIENSVFAGDYADFEMTMMVVQYVADAGITWGRQTLSALLFFVPRSIFSIKADPTGPAVAAYFGLRYTNLSTPVFAELFADFWYIGVFAGMYLLSSMFSVLQRRLAAKVGMDALPAIGVLAFFPIIMRGSLLAVIPQFIMIPIIYIMLLKYLRSVAPRLGSENEGDRRRQSPEVVG